MTPLRQRDQQQLMHQWNYEIIQNCQTVSNTTTNSLAASTANAMKHHQQAQHFDVLNTRLHQQHATAPPDLPIRQENLSSQAGAATAWIKPLSQAVDAGFHRHKTTQQNSQEQTPQQQQQVLKNSKLEPPAADSTTTSCTSTSAAVNLMKRLAHIKHRSKSPAATNNAPAHAAVNSTSSATFSMDIPSFEDNLLNSNNMASTKAAGVPQLQAVHVR